MDDLYASVEHYRDDVRLTTHCPACTAQPTELCRKLDTGEPVGYVHDDRSAIHANELIA